MDIVDAETRSKMMSAIRGKDTRPEMVVRRALHALGFRYRLHDQRLPGRPDLSFPRFQAVIRVHGCFWHGHDCYLFKTPGTRTEFWLEKIQANRRRDERNLAALATLQWRVCTIWECAIKGRSHMNQLPDLIAAVAGWLESGQASAEFTGGANSQGRVAYRIADTASLVAETPFQPLKALST